MIFLKKFHVLGENARRCARLKIGVAYLLDIVGYAVIHEDGNPQIGIVHCQFPKFLAYSDRQKPINSQRFMREEINIHFNDEAFAKLLKARRIGHSGQANRDPESRFSSSSGFRLSPE